MCPPQTDILEAAPPRFTPVEASAMAAELFGISGRATELGSERDQAFMLDDGAAGGVFKVSNLGETATTLDFEAAAIRHIGRADPELPVAQLRPCPSAGDAVDLAAYRPTVEGPDGLHFCRLFEKMPGRASIEGGDISDRTLKELGRSLAELGLALRGFFHPAAGRRLLWDTHHALDLRALVPTIPDSRQRGLVDRALDRYEARVAPRWSRLRSQVIHGDLTLDNALIDDAGRVSGIVDFGDIVHSALITDLASTLADVLRRCEGDELRSARLVIDGYQSRTPLEPLELDLLGDLLMARLCALVAISAWRVLSYPENAEYIQSADAGSWKLIDLLDDAGPAAVAAELGAVAAPVATAGLARRRRQLLGPALIGLTYSEPVHIDRAEGPWLFEVGGRRLLDAYNNVPVVGHCHPRVTEAVVKQTRLLNTHSRYLYEPLVEIAERLVALMPEGSGLDTVAVVNSGSEANDLAWQIAQIATGGTGALATDFAYHGVTEAALIVSPESWPAGRQPPNVATVSMTDPAGLAQQTEDALVALRERGYPPAAAYLDTGFTSDGMATPQQHEIQALVDAWRRADGLFVADEVQAGHGRSGEAFWSFERFGVTPDFVTLGKPMGNGYPVAALVTRADLMEQFAEATEFFSTFGGNPVASRAAIAVLDVIRDERLMQSAASTGELLRGLLREVAGRYAQLGDIRGRGLLIGVDVIAEDGSPDAAGCARIVDELRRRGVLIGKTGPHANILKIRPPLVFGAEHAELMARTLDDVLAETPG